MPVLDEDLEAIHAGFAEKDRLRDSLVLVTGAAGFLGYMLLQYLARHQKALGVRRILALDRFLLGRPAWLDNLVRDCSALEVRPFDIAWDSLEEVPGAADCRFVLHMASIASPPFYRQYPLETLDANVWGLRRLLDFYRHKNLTGMLFFSSSEIYGDPPHDAIPTPEDYRGHVACTGPRACYDEAKRFGETLCHVFHGKYGLPVGIARPFNNYGPGLRLGDRRAPADFVRAILENRAIELFSDGTPTRTFCYVSDALTGYLKILTRGQGEAFNIGIAGPEITVARLAGLFVEAGRAHAGYTAEGVRFARSGDADYLRDNPNRRCPVIAKAERLLDYRPRVPVEEGVGRYLRFLLENGDAR